MNTINDSSHKRIIGYAFLLVFISAAAFLIIGYRYQYIPLNNQNNAWVMKIDRITGEHCYLIPQAEISDEKLSLPSICE